MSDKSSLSEDELMAAMKQLGEHGLPDSVPMLPDSAVELGGAHRIDVKEQASGISSDSQVATRSRLNSEPSGYILVMMPTSYSRKLAEAMLSDLYEDEPDAEMIQDTAEELANLLISNYVDGFADLLNQNIQHKAPETMQTPMNEIVVKTANKASSRYAFVYGVALVINDNHLPVYLYYIPEIEELVNIIQQQMNA